MTLPPDRSLPGLRELRPARPGSMIAHRAPGHGNPVTRRAASGPFLEVAEDEDFVILLAGVFP